MTWKRNLAAAAAAALIALLTFPCALRRCAGPGESEGRCAARVKTGAQSAAASYRPFVTHKERSRRTARLSSDRTERREPEPAATEPKVYDFNTHIELLTDPTVR